MRIRPATISDVPRLVAMGQRFCAEPTYRDVWPENVAALEAMAMRLVEGPASVVLVAERDGAVVGMLGVLLYAHHLSGVWVAGEVMWWVEPEARGAGLALLRAAETWAAEAGAEQIQMVAPGGEGARVGALYQRRGYRRIEETYARPVTPAMTAIRVVDDVWPDLAAYRGRALAQPVGDVVPRPGLVFHGLAVPPDDSLARWITRRYPVLVPTLSFLRHSPAGQDEPHYLHTDAEMGDWTAIAYLTADPPPGDGTIFWRHGGTGAIQGEADAAAWADLAAWTPWYTVPARPGRVVLFPARYYHSRALPDNYGAGDTARLIQVVFGTGALALGGG